MYQARIASDLIELRNKSVFAFFMANALFVLIVFLLQLNKDKLHIIWPLGVKTNITYIEETSEVYNPKYQFNSNQILNCVYGFYYQQQKQKQKQPVLFCSVLCISMCVF